MSRYIPVEPEKWAEMVKAMADNRLLKAEVERLKNNCDYLDRELDREIEKTAMLCGQVERLRKAGDAMAERCLKMQYTEVPWEYGPKWYAWHSKAEASVQAWNAAKEGKQP